MTEEGMKALEESMKARIRKKKAELADYDYQKSLHTAIAVLTRSAGRKNWEDTFTASQIEHFFDMAVETFYE